MISDNKLLHLLGWVVTILTTLSIIMLSVRVLINPAYARLQYALPGFPEDPYGFTRNDRLRWSEPTIRYLVNREDINYLAELEFEEGEPIYNQRELQHMEDVKEVVIIMRLVLSGSVLLLTGATWFAVKKGQEIFLLKSFRRGAWGVIGLMVAILFFVMLNFNRLFTWFHQMFFEAGTWLFHPSDTLIRLYPLRFWRDTFIIAGFLSLVFSIIIILFCDRQIKSHSTQIE